MIPSAFQILFALQKSSKDSCYYNIKWLNSSIHIQIFTFLHDTKYVLRTTFSSNFLSFQSILWLEYNSDQDIAGHPTSMIENKQPKTKLKKLL